MAKRNSFIVYADWLDVVKPLSDAECGRLFMALMQYAKLGAAPELQGNERFIFPMMASQIDRDARRYVEKCTKNAENAKKRTQATASDRKRPQANASETQRTHSDTDDDDDTDDDTDTGTDKGLQPLRPTAPSSPLAHAREDPIERYRKYNHGKEPTERVKTALREFQDFMDDELISHAIDIAADNGKDGWRYISAILEDWAQKGFRCLGDAEVEQADWEMQRRGFEF